MNKKLIYAEDATKTALEFFVEFYGRAFDEEIQMMLLKRMNDLPPAETEQCEYCHEDSDGYVSPIEKNNHAFVRFGMNGWELSMKANGWHGSAKIRYCPMCGRRLSWRGGAQ